MNLAFKQVKETTEMNRLPLVITAPGDYVTRDGRRVTIFRVQPGSEPRHEVTRFEAKGAIWRMYRGKMRARSQNIWHLSGRCEVGGPSKNDIVGPWPEEV